MSIKGIDPLYTVTREDTEKALKAQAAMHKEIEQVPLNAPDRDKLVQAIRQKYASTLSILQ